MKQLRELSTDTLIKLVLKLRDENSTLKESKDYWEDISTKQNECILFMSDRYSNLETKYADLKQDYNKVTSTNYKNIEAEAVLKRTLKRNSKLDSMLDSYEETYKNTRNELQEAQNTIKELQEKVYCTKNDLEIYKNNESLYLRKINELKIEKEQAELRHKLSLKSISFNFGE
jgi:chromosome segregation ATPase